MIRTLIKKEFLSMWRSLFVNSKTGEKRTKSRTALFILLYAALGLFLVGIFFGLSYELGSVFVQMGLGWFYFSIIAMLSLAMGIFGDVFNTYQMMYASKDNDLLFSLPIGSSHILLSRMLVVFITGSGYLSLVFVPGIVAYWVASPSFSFAVLLLQIVVLFFLSLLVTTLTCALGWVIAKLSAKMKSRNVAKIIATLLFFAVYYFVSAKSGEYIQLLIANAESASSALRGFYLAYAVGSGSAGSVSDTLLFAAVSAALFALCFGIISRSYIRLSTENGKSVKKAYSASRIHSSGSDRALMKREAKRFIGSTVYALNTGLGIVVLVVGSVALFFLKDRFMPLLSSLEDAGMGGLASIVVCAILMAVISMNCISAPSVSLEGKNIWIVQSLPLDPWRILRSKVMFCFILNALSSLVFILASAILSIVPLPDLPFVIILDLLFSMVVSETGLVLNIVHPSLHWTNEAVCVKNGLATFIVLFGGWIVTAVFCFVYFKFLLGVMSVVFYLLIFTSVFAAAVVFETLWLRKKGSKLFQYLS